MIDCTFLDIFSRDKKRNRHSHKEILIEFDRKRISTRFIVWRGKGDTIISKNQSYPAGTIGITGE